MKRLFYILLLISNSAFGMQNDALFEEANALYNENKFTEAIAKYEEILRTGVHSSELYYNLANAHYKLNNIAPSVYYYEKARLLDPNDKDIANNLAFAQNMTIDAIDEMPQTGLSRFSERILGKLSYNNWAMLSVIFVFLFVILFLVYYFSYSSLTKRIGFIASTILLLLAIASVTIAFQQFEIDKEDNPAIVFAEKTSVRTGPKYSDEEVFVLHEGTKVQVLEGFDNWQRIKLADGKIGWIPQDDIRMLKDF
ncbi:tetratricopeptide repeat protein [Sungkyunkwania multivorans]|uniref:Tetratricopeptide repeat protein n=1 Tax=Sungkyunkwania multivorans TaxID=1173618 RepID=A0ABW3D2L6_9FLAO